MSSNFPFNLEISWRKAIVFLSGRTRCRRPVFRPVSGISMHALHDLYRVRGQRAGSFIFPLACLQRVAGLTTSLSGCSVERWKVFRSVAIFVLALGVSQASATSILNYDEDRIINILAETTIIASECGPAVVVNHDMRDLVSDVLALKVGDLSAEPHISKYYTAVDNYEESAETGPSIFCLAAVGKYGKEGKMVRGLVISN